MSAKLVRVPSFRCKEHPDEKGIERLSFIVLISSKVCCNGHLDEKGTEREHIPPSPRRRSSRCNGHPDEKGTESRNLQA